MGEAGREPYQAEKGEELICPSLVSAEVVGARKGRIHLLVVVAVFALHPILSFSLERINPREGTLELPGEVEGVRRCLLAGAQEEAHLLCRTKQISFCFHKLKNKKEK